MIAKPNHNIEKKTQCSYVYVIETKVLLFPTCAALSYVANIGIAIVPHF